jgi:FAD/FMN-containing dehydrogenase
MQDTQVLTLTETTAQLSDQAVERFKQDIRGTVLRSSDAGYEDARKVWNGMIDRRPALIVRAHGAADVISAVNFARAQGLPVTVRGGGHNVAGSAVQDGALLIDLSEMRGVRVDPARSVVRVEGGATLGDIDHETQAFGLALPSGLMSETGIAGLALHGGLGFLMRKYGLTCDQLVSADVVTADGELRQVDASHHADLFWAMRGGGGAGIVTSFEFRVHPVGPDVWIGLVMYPVAEAKTVLTFFRSFMAQARDELMGIAVYQNAPTSDDVPEEIRGVPVILIGCCWSGAFAEGEQAIKPLRELGAPLLDMSGPMQFLAAQRLFDPEYPKGERYYWKSTLLAEISDELIGVLSELAARRPSPRNLIAVWALGGAIAQVRSGDSAYFQRDAPWLVSIEGNSAESAIDDANIAWVRDLYRALQGFSSAGSYLNFPGFHEEGAVVLQQSYGENYQRLHEIRARYDPQGLFRFNVQMPAKE